LGQSGGEFEGRAAIGYRLAVRITPHASIQATVRIGGQRDQANDRGNAGNSSSRQDDDDRDDGSADRTGLDGSVVSRFC
jgi:hypothetical protein